YTPEGDAWRREMLAYVEENIDFICDYCSRYLPGIRAIRPQASFLVWLDCRGLQLDHDALIDLFVERARLALNDGEMFGPGGEGHMRLNAAAPRAVIEQALGRLRDALA
ncbi:MAG: cystathionine beta-lyase, partial [Muribaculaceae bacterium]|nr:cystathionine beta-lyase [Muribaculaceae bacterium]